MRKLTPDLLRFRTFQIGDDPSDIQGNYLVPHPQIKGYYYFMVCTSGLGREHVSISLKKKGLASKRSSMMDVGRTPTWAEMCYVKGLFWGDDEVVVQYHPRKKDHVSMHNYCLHLWRPTDQDLPEPSALMVGMNPDQSPEEALEQITDLIKKHENKT